MGLLLLLSCLRHRGGLTETLLNSIGVWLGTTSSCGTWGYVSRRIRPKISSRRRRICPLLLGLIVLPLVRRAWHILWHRHGPLDRREPLLGRGRSAICRHAIRRRSRASARALLVSRIVSLHV